MKILLLLLLSICSMNCFAQEGHHRKHRERHDRENDYFTAGLYTGTYISKTPLSEPNFYFNSIAAEIEYFKFSDLALIVGGIYQFTKSDDITPDYGGVTYLSKPSSYKLNVSINGRYYLGRKKVKPYLQTGINQETTYIGSYSYIQQYEPGFSYSGSTTPAYSFRYFINFGVGFNVKLGEKTAFDMKYDLYKTLGRNNRYSGDGGFNGFSVLAGIKYKL